MTYYPPESVGWGNVALCISDLVYRSPTPRVYKSLCDFDRGVDFSGFEITDDPDDTPFEPRIAINPTYYHQVHSNLKDVIKPNVELQKLIESMTMVSFMVFIFDEVHAQMIQHLWGVTV